MARRRSEGSNGIPIPPNLQKLCVLLVFRLKIAACSPAPVRENPTTKIRIFRREEVLSEITEADRVTHLKPLGGTSRVGSSAGEEGTMGTTWAYGLANGESPGSETKSSRKRLWLSPMRPVLRFARTKNVLSVVVSDSIHEGSSGVTPDWRRTSALRKRAGVQSFRRFHAGHILEIVCADTVH